MLFVSLIKQVRYVYCFKKKIKIVYHVDSTATDTIFMTVVFFLFNFVCFNWILSFELKRRRLSKQRKTQNQTDKEQTRLHSISHSLCWNNQDCHTKILSQELKIQLNRRKEKRFCLFLSHNISSKLSTAIYVWGKIKMFL